MVRQWIYDNTAPLKCVSHPFPERSLGVLVSEPFLHRGLKEQYVEVHIEGVSIFTTSLGCWAPEGEAEQEYQKATEGIISRLDEMIAELTQHRRRLAASLAAVAKAEAG